jgi:hypothetical protein
MPEHSGAYVFAHVGLRIHFCAHSGVRFKFTTARSPKALRSIAETEKTHVMRLRIPAIVNFMVHAPVQVLDHGSGG